MSLVHEDVERWLRGYEQVWRTAGTAGLADLFGDRASYLPSPWAEPLVGLPAIADFWEAERKGPEEEFTLTHEVVALDGPVAVLRVEVDYPDSRWRDLWVLRFAGDGRVEAFEEWPFAPATPDGHPTTSAG